ncbi:SDR family oxidoreductase [Pontivivens ytuae]|uniref:SDR family oxidoreductase n=1 Tax=Pontivivens ytuae TaxID=2789856 RepID=A0A7S9LP55_9RHOB|nr:SDR family oxidoreductase [Pontivivens ytuae]QPH52727.1 SDR family oxidoreductase [Pontivivens ytuae]
MSYLEDLFGVSGKVALVTGGATGIGRMIAEALAAGGATVMIASRKAEACKAVAEEINGSGLPGRVEGFGGDVSTPEGIAALVGEVKGRTGALHILVNNAGITWGEPFETFPMEQWSRVMDVNVGAMFTLTRDLTPLLEAAATHADPARIINIGSVMGTVPLAEGAYSYTMSKAAVHHMTKVLATELASKRITVNAFAPGPFPSKMTRFATGTAEKAEKVGANVPLGRIGTPEDMAGATLYLCGRGGAYVSGAILPLDGGMSVEAPLNLFANVG